MARINPNKTKYQQRRANSKLTRTLSFIFLAILTATAIYHLLLADPEPVQLQTQTTLSETENREKSSIAANSQRNALLPPKFTGEMTIVINGGKPEFSKDELKPVAWENYSPLDHLGRVGIANAVLGKETMPKEKRKSIRHIRPSGWRQAMYDFIPGKSLFNRSHLIGFQLSAENDNEQNLMTGTQTFNQDEMVPFENLVADYIRETNNHVRYRVTPIFSGNERIARGVQIEAFSIEDQGDGVQFNVFIHNVQKGVVINYLNGKSELAK